MRGVSLSEISAATRISTRFLEAIENGQWEQLPGGAFNRGFIRSASRYLGLNEESMVAEYALETKGNGATPAAPQATSELPRDWRPLAALIGVLIVLVAGGWFAGTKIIARFRAHRALPSASVTGSGAKGERTPPVAVGPLRLTIQASQTVHVEVVADGQSVFQGEVAANETKQFSARDSFQISSGDAAAVRLELNGQPVPTMGPAGQAGQVTLTTKDLKSPAGGVH